MDDGNLVDHNRGVGDAVALYLAGRDACFVQFDAETSDFV
ncbi:hypothetical protein IMSAGC012_00133 [Lachnospiraceae bacterium]|nr:hypothetical protein IMSAGC012_00133 [Lachnospiraceae bacterium]